MVATLNTTVIQNASSSTPNITLDTAGNAVFGNMPYGTSSFLRNKIINGTMDISQRGTSFSSPTNQSYTLDRWKFWGDGSGGTLTITQASLSPAELVPFSYAIRLNQSVGATARSYFRINQYIEGLEQFSGQTITVSFYAKCASGTVASTLRCDRYFGTGGSPSAADNMSYSSGGSPTITTTWTRYTATATVSSTSGKTYGTNNDSSLLVGVDLPISGTFDVYITGFQVEFGTVATPFEKRLFGQELALCQRYYNQYGAGLTGFFNGSTNMEVPIVFFVTMRTTPTVSLVQSSITVSNKNNGTTAAQTATLVNSSGTQNGFYYIQLGSVGTGLSASAGNIGQFRTDGFLGLSAEL
jgi:hypothetical protein